MEDAVRTEQPAAEAFIAKWQGVAASELSTPQSFLIDLCALPAAEGRPPFVVEVDVGQRIELYSEFSRSGGTCVPFPDPRSHRIQRSGRQRSGRSANG